MNGPSSIPGRAAAAAGFALYEKGCLQVWGGGDDDAL